MVFMLRPCAIQMKGWRDIAYRNSLAITPKQRTLTPDSPIWTDPAPEESKRVSEQVSEQVSENGEVPACR